MNASADASLAVDLGIPNVEHAEFWTRGSRSVVYRAVFQGQYVAVKTPVAESAAPVVLLREARALQLVNRWRIGPPLVAAAPDYVLTQFVTGLDLDQWLLRASPQRIHALLADLLRQAYLLDFLGVNKGEMHRLRYNVIVDVRDRPILLDFEKLSVSAAPQNLSQISQYLGRRSRLWQELGLQPTPDAVRPAVLAYKRAPSASAYLRLRDALIGAAPHDHACPCCAASPGPALARLRKQAAANRFSSEARLLARRRLRLSAPKR